jgi:hypothetical protein
VLVINGHARRYRGVADEVGKGGTGTKGFPALVCNGCGSGGVAGLVLVLM